MITRFKNFPSLKTRRLTLREINLNDQEQVFKIRSDKKVNEYLDRAPAKNIKEAVSHIDKLKKLYEDAAAITWAINLKGDDLFMGSVCFWNYNHETENVEIGYAMIPEFQGKGYCSEAIETGLDFTLTQMQVKTVSGEVHKENKASIHLLQKFGFIAQGECSWNKNYLTYRLEL